VAGVAQSFQLKTAEEFFEGFAEGDWGCDQAQDEMVGRREIVEVTGVEEDVVLAEEVDREGFVGGGNGGVGEGVGDVTERGVPAGFGVEEFTGGVGAELGLEVGEIFLDASEELRAEGMALGEEHGESGLGGRAE
jgi:hypothetical protein